MIESAKIITTNSYFHIFSILCRELDGKTSIDERNLIFMEEKGSLMAESSICATFGGAFNTEVYSFGNYLRLKRGEDKVLSKEGASMVIKKLLEGLNLKLLNRGKDVAPTIYELIALLKSAGVSVKDITEASERAKGMLKTKLTDIGIVYSAYENYLKEKGVEDQSSFISLLPNLIESLDEVKDANIFVVGFSGLTSQNLSAIKAFIKRAKSFTAILPYGENKLAFVNETLERVKSVCDELNVKVNLITEKTPYNFEGEIISSSLFNPLKKQEDNKTDKIHLLPAKSLDEEAESIASIIKSEVLKGKRYKDFTVVLPEASENTHVKKAFDLLEVPYYIDTNYKVENHPIITLIFSYVDCLIKKGDRERILSLIKNPFYSSDKALNDAFINYVYKYNVNFSEFFTPFTYPARSKEEFFAIENLRKRLEADLKVFNVREFLEKLNVEKKAVEYAVKLKELGSAPEGALTEQIYAKVIHIIEEMESILGYGIDKKEFKKLFTSGVSALKLSILPQYNDAVFIGGFKECARARSKNLFVSGLTASVPGVTDDTALLSDLEIDMLHNLKVIVEPKVKIINHRVREEIVVALSSFSEKLYLSYAQNELNGKKKEKSEIISFFEKAFTLLEFPKTERYLSDRQALKSFANDIAEFREWSKTDIAEALALLEADEKNRAKNILESANTEIAKRIDNANVLLDSHISPTSVEDFYRCPYRFFIGKTLGVKEREIGEISSNEMGTIMHNVFYNFASSLPSVDNEEGAKKLYLACKEEAVKDERNRKYFSSPSTENAFFYALNECEKHCLDLYEFVSNTTFKTEKDNLEKSVAIELLDGEVTLNGKVDRIDTTDEYFRVIDYKTGGADSKDGALYMGVKLQLWLYSLSVKDKTLAGVYYYDVKDEYSTPEGKDKTLLKGKTLSDEKVFAMHDKNLLTEGKSKFIPVRVVDGKIAGALSSETLLAYQKYAKTMCERAINEMKKGTIIPSPYAGTCSWCKYKSICLNDGENERGKLDVNEREIASAVEGGEEDAKA